MECLAPRSRRGELDDSDDHEPGNAPGLSSRVVGEKTSFTLSFVGVHPGGGSCFFAAQAVTLACRMFLLVAVRIGRYCDRSKNEDGRETRTRSKGFTSSQDRNFRLAL